MKYPRRWLAALLLLAQPLAFPAAAGAAGLNHAPEAFSFWFNTREDMPYSGRLRGQDADGDPLTWRLDQSPMRGQVRVDRLTGDFVYTPNQDFFGDDAFVVSAYDGQAWSDPVSIAFSVAEIDDPPEGRSETFFFDPAAAFTGQMYGRDAEQEEVRWFMTEYPKKGDFDYNPTTGRFSYRARPGETGSDTFAYLVKSGIKSSGINRVWLNERREMPAFAMDRELSVLLSREVQKFPGWARETRPGWPDSVPAALSFNLRVSDPSLFVRQPAISPDGTLSFQTAQKEAEATISVTLVAADPTGATRSSAATSFRVRAARSNLPPVFEGQEVRLREEERIAYGPARDPDGDRVAYRLVAGDLPAGVVLADGLAGAPRLGTAGRYPLKLAAGDGRVWSEGEVTLVVEPLRTELSVSSVLDFPAKVWPAYQLVDGQGRVAASGTAGEAGGPVRLEAPPGRYKLRVDRPGAPDLAEVALKRDEAGSITVNPTMAALTLEGRVLNRDGGAGADWVARVARPDGLPVSGVAITLRLGDDEIPLTTGDDGSAAYRQAELPHGGQLAEVRALDAVRLIVSRTFLGLRPGLDGAYLSETRPGAGIRLRAVVGADAVPARRADPLNLDVTGDLLGLQGGALTGEVWADLSAVRRVPLHVSARGAVVEVPPGAWEVPALEIYQDVPGVRIYLEVR